MEKNNILCPKSFVVTKNSKINNLNFNFPIILKPLTGGSTVDLSKAKNKTELNTILEKVFKKYKTFLLQEFVEGREFTCGVIDIKRKTLALPVSQVILNGQEIFDYEAKYNTSGLEFTPAKIDTKLSNKIKKLGKKIHQITGCVGVTRTDIIINAKRKLFVLEINTIPGLTKVSFVPEQLKVQGITIPEFIDIMVQNQDKK